MISRWLSLVLCLSLLILIVSPVQSDSNLVLNPGFEEGVNDAITYWTNIHDDAALVVSPVHGGVYSVGPKGTAGMELSQCVVDTSALSGTARVSAWVYALFDHNARIEVTWYAAKDCAGDVLASATYVEDEGYRAWVELGDVFPSAAEGHQSVLITLRTVEEDAWFDDVFLGSLPTAVTLGGLTGRSGAAWGAGVAMGLVGAALTLLRRRPLPKR
jgi:hypothetical protein